MYIHIVFMYLLIDFRSFSNLMQYLFCSLNLYSNGLGYLAFVIVDTFFFGLIMKVIVDKVYDVVFLPVTLLDHFARFEWLLYLCKCKCLKGHKKSKKSKKEGEKQKTE